MKRVMVCGMIMAVLGLAGPLPAKEISGVVRVKDTRTLEALEKLKIRQHTGVITQVNAEEQNFVIKNKRGEHRFAITSDTQVKKGRKRFGIADLQSGMKVTVKYWEKENTKIAKIIKLPKK